MAEFKFPFAALVIVQVAHSVEECLGRLWESYPPAAVLAGLISADRATGFVVANAVLVVFGLWCFIWPVRLEWRLATGLAWTWVVIELVNGIVHPLWSVIQGRYTPGTLTAPLLFALAAYLAFQLREDRRVSAPHT